jgi:hypothetical protein
VNIGYTKPLHRAWTRSRKLLFSPFDLGRWIVLGFAAFLADLTDLWGAGGGSGGNLELDDVDADTLEKIAEGGTRFLTDKIDLVLASTGLVLLAGSLIAAILLVYLTLIWVSSRGKFIFLENVVHRSSRITAPWSEYRSEGNSVFRFRVIFDVANNLLAITFVLTIILLLVPSIAEERLLPFSAGSLMVSGWVGVVLLIIGGYVSAFLENFIIPLMYRERIGVMEAWRRFGALFRRYTLEFLLFGVFVAVFWIAVLTGILLLGLATCCIGFLVLAIPFLNSILLLPVTVMYRALGPEFLAQFGEEFRIFPEDPPPGS